MKIVLFPWQTYKFGSCHILLILLWKLKNYCYFLGRFAAVNSKQRTRRCFSTFYTTVWFFLLQLMSSNGTGLLQCSTHHTFCATEQLKLYPHLSPSVLHLAPCGSTLTPERYGVPQINFFCLGNISKGWKYLECSPFTGEI